MAGPRALRLSVLVHGQKQCPRRETAGGISFWGSGSPGESTLRSRFQPRNANLSKLLMKTKFTSWSYEKEHRIVVPLNDTAPEGTLRFYNLNETTVQLAEVILGAECSLPVQKIREVVRGSYPNVAVFQARLADGFFGIVPNEKTVVQVPC